MVILGKISHLGFCIKSVAPQDDSMPVEIGLVLVEYRHHPCNVPMAYQVLYRMLRPFVLLLISLVLSGESYAQTACSIIGQTPQSAFPVCGTTNFYQDTVPQCGSKSIPVPGCGGVNAGYFDLNPYWYKFTCYSSGTLDFKITPNNLKDDYDWQLFDITGHDPGDVFTNPSLFVCGNWAGTYGVTGASGNAAHSIECASDPTAAILTPTFSKSPNLIKGHQYLLIISHFSGDSQSGYALSFAGGTASITDTVQPHMKSVRVSCDGTELFVKLNKSMKCATLANNGSDFRLNSSVVGVVSASGYNCSSGFDMDSVHLVLSQPLSPGQYKLIAQNGSDNNTVLDNCATPIPVGEGINFEVLPLQPTPMDSVEPVSCAPGYIRLVFKKRIRCNSIANDGSDFTISGPGPITVIGASGSCSTGITDYIDVKLASPIYAAGNYQVMLKAGTDGNTIEDECGQSTPAGATVNFLGYDTVSASINYQVLWGCKVDTITLFNNGGSSITQWQWIFDDGSGSSTQNAQVLYSEFGDKKVQLIVTNGVCSDTSIVNVALDNTLKADFETTPLLCPADKAIFVNRSIGHIVQWAWNFGDGSTDDHPTPGDHYYPTNPMADKEFTISLVTMDNLGCYDTTYQTVKKLHSCVIAVPSAFTPNGDGINDYLYPLNGFKADNLQFRVYNRYGQLIFQSADWTNRWDGTIGGKPQGPGTFVWTLQYTDRDTGQKVVQKGTSVLIR